MKSPTELFVVSYHLLLSRSNGTDDDKHTCRLVLVAAVVVVTVVTIWQTGGHPYTW